MNKKKRQKLVKLVLVLSYIVFDINEVVDSIFAIRFHTTMAIQKKKKQQNSVLSQIRAMIFAGTNYYFTKGLSTEVLFE